MNVRCYNEISKADVPRCFKRLDIIQLIKSVAKYLYKNKLDDIQLENFNLFETGFNFLVPNITFILIEVHTLYNSHVIARSRYSQRQCQHRFK